MFCNRENDPLVTPPILFAPFDPDSYDRLRVYEEVRHTPMQVTRYTYSQPVRFVPFRCPADARGGLAARRARNEGRPCGERGSV